MIHSNKNSISTINHTSTPTSLEERLKNIRNDKFTESTALQNMILAIIDMPFKDYMHSYPTKYQEVMRFYEKSNPSHKDVSTGEIFAFCVDYFKNSPWEKQSISLKQTDIFVSRTDSCLEKPLGILITDLCAPLRCYYFGIHEETDDQDQCEENYQDYYQKLPNPVFFAPETDGSEALIPTKTGDYLYHLLTKISLEDYLNALLALEPKKLGTTKLKYNNLSQMGIDLDKSFIKSFPFYHKSRNSKKKRYNNVLYAETADDYFYPFFLFPLGTIAARKNLILNRRSTL